MENSLTPAERADVIKNISIKQNMLFGIPVTEEHFDALHDMTDSALFGISLSLTLLIMKSRKEQG